MNLANHSVWVRHPWPDELERLRVFLPRREFTESPWLWVMLSGHPERIVGAAALEPLGSSAKMYLALRPRWRSMSETKILLSTVLEKAQSLNAVSITSEFIHGQAPVPALTESGFTLTREEQVWEIPLDGLGPRIDRVAGIACGRLRRLGQVWIGPPPDHLMSEVLLVLKDHGLVSESAFQFDDHSLLEYAPPRNPDNVPSLVTPLQSLSTRFSRQLSSVLTIDGIVAGVFLNRALNQDKCFVQFRAVAKAFRTYSSLINSAILHRALRSTVDNKFHFAIATARVGAQDETIHFAQKSGGHLLQQTDIFSLGGDGPAEP